MSRDLLGAISVHPGRRLTARLAETLAVVDAASFETQRVPGLTLTLEGVPGDPHAGFTRRAGPREPWHPRGAEIRSGRQLSIVSVEELAEIASAMGHSVVEAGWIGADLVMEGLPSLSFLPAGTRLFFEGGACVVVEAQNAPCRHAGRAIAGHTGRPGDELSFPKIAKRLRGVVASVERVGEVAAGSDVVVRVPEQWIY
ncbi:hypothetical protein [Methylopila sp. 73B]|uniref:MOSC domain-containing protein n=1 Tax=Methylopila sp. 73B TaxID=1120792 RepID=UPI000375AB17|nr:hypothetical protein [Methylopila sp. 73B]